VLLGHLDVVPAGPETEGTWTHPPFAGAVTDSHLIGRGAIDDKGSVNAILEAVTSLMEGGFAPTRTVMLCFGHDEESGGSTGAGAMVERLIDRNVRAHLVLDEGGFVTEGVLPLTRRPLALVGVAEKGYMDVELTAGADPGHSSVPPGRTAIGALAAAVAALVENQAPARPEFQREFFEAVSMAAGRTNRALIKRIPRLPGSARLLGRRATTNALIRTTTAPTMIEGGVKSNVLPATARAVVNFRLLPGDTRDATVERIEDIVGGGIEVGVLDGWEASRVSSTDAEQFRTVREVVGEVFADAVVAPWTVVGATDARYYSAISDHVLRFLPFRLNESELTGFHGIDERVRLDAGTEATGFYRCLIERMCG
jgi:carboxypeptidase PM20D1